jgi:hypothetical protein
MPIALISFTSIDWPFYLIARNSFLKADRIHYVRQFGSYYAFSTYFSP